MNRSKIFLSFLLIITSISFSSCFEIVEELFVRKNGSGHFSFTLNMSESKTKLASLMLLDSVQGYKIPSKQELKKQTEIVNQKLKQIPGLSNVGTNLDLNEFTTVIKFDFTNVQQINQAMKVLIEYYKINNYSVPQYSYDVHQQVLVRNFESKQSTIHAFDKMKKEDKVIFQKSKYTSIYKFENEIVSSSNTAAKLAKNKKAVMQQSELLNIITNKSNINQKIKTQ